MTNPTEPDPARPSALSPRRGLWTLALLSFSALFWELAFIRWVPGSVRVVGYFTNLILIASFLGLGAGALLSKRGTSLGSSASSSSSPSSSRLVDDNALLRWWPATFAILVLATLIFGSLMTPDPAGEFIWQGAAPWLPRHASGWVQSLNLWVWDALAASMQDVNFYVVVSVLFVLTAAHFVLIGHRIGRLFGVLPPLAAYSFDIAGSIVGIVVFSLVCSLSLPPIAWFGLGSVALGVLTPWRGVGGVVRAVLVAVSLVLVLASGSGYLWSPYYKIEVSPVAASRLDKDDTARDADKPIGYRVQVNNDYHQMALDLASPATADSFLMGWRRLYDLPYSGGHAPGDVLIVGAGTGNDVMAALRAGARSVTAVEIDATIHRIGTELHPEQPYSDPRVTVVIDDARSYLKRAKSGSFDTVVFGFLDSHTLLSSLSTLRIDNYVYTVASFAEAMQSLRPGGRLAVTFATATVWLKARLFGLMTTALGHAPQTTKVKFTNGRIFWGERSANWQPPTAAAVAAVANEVELPTDNWPFLYLQRPVIPTHYLFFMVIVVLLGIASFRLVEPGSRELNLQFLFLGAGFLLLETRSVTEIALLFGSTWAVNAIAFCAILVAVLAANLVVQRWPNPPVRYLYPIVVVLLIGGGMLEPGVLYVPSFVGRLALCGVVIFSPIFVAGLIFSGQFRDAKSANVLFGSNLIGAMIGGALEYSSLMVGLSPLYFLGAALYLCAMLAWMRRV